MCYVIYEQPLTWVQYKLHVNDQNVPGRKFSDTQALQVPSNWKKIFEINFGAWNTGNDKASISLLHTEPLKTRKWSCQAFKNSLTCSKINMSSIRGVTKTIFLMKIRTRWRRTKMTSPGRRKSKLAKKRSPRRVPKIFLTHSSNFTLLLKNNYKLL